MLTLHPEWIGRRCCQGGAWNGRHPRDRHDEPDGSRRLPPLDQHEDVYRGSRKRAYLGGLPLPLLNAHRDGNGIPDWRICREERDAASRGGFTMTRVSPSSFLWARPCAVGFKLAN